MIVIGGVFLLHFGIIASIMLYNIGLVAGVANSMAPLLRIAQPTPPPQLTATSKNSIIGLTQDEPRWEH